MFKPDRKKAKPGEIVEFEMGGMLVKGEVLPSKTKNSIIVDISAIKGYEKMNYGYPNTVVNHKKYRIVDEMPDENLNVNHMRSVMG
ncbi:Uncharacterized protein YkvS [Lentibacillus halodurans]|uniref:Uncharacterized protein YkvS n=1 Tax=Lentibacillus halodurans TaxID=237679 RepID=A0A1I0YKQ8_9BACI|nr:DUF2187 family protein [Lentibacillus halodurans]SFB13979.1 Uncharacterized protein YkvS [Lentibacillus halodurans]